MDSDEDLYDEFGNIIGDPLDSDAESFKANSRANSVDDIVQDNDITQIERTSVNETSDVRSMTLTDFVQDIEILEAGEENPLADEAVIPVDESRTLRLEIGQLGNDEPNFHIDESKIPAVKYSRKYLLETASKATQRVRNVSFVGGFHCGKTTFLDMLVKSTHEEESRGKSTKSLKFTDNHKLEIERELSIEQSPITLLLKDSRGRSLVSNIVDTPGHPDFLDEVTSSLQLIDGVVHFIDSVDGLTPSDKQILTEALRRDLPITVVLNKIDRLVLELHLPVMDFYYKLRYILDDLNSYLMEHELWQSYSHRSYFSPVQQNVLFASGTFEFCFGTQFFADIYSSRFEFISIDIEDFAGMLWGEHFYDADNKMIINSSMNGKYKRTFECMVAEPLYKLFTYSLTSDSPSDTISEVLWAYFQIKLPKSIYEQNSKILLKEVFRAVFKDAVSFADILKLRFPEPASSVLSIEKKYGVKVKPDSLIAYCSKLLPNHDGSCFYSIVRIHSGTLVQGMQVKVLGENFREDPDEFKIETVKGIYIPGGRYKVPVTAAPTGSLVILEGIDATILKGATICDSKDTNSFEFKHPCYSSRSVYKIGVEPVNPSEFPQLLQGLRKVNKSYISSVVKVEESGEHVVLAPGELYMDCLLHDLRSYFTNNIEIRVSDPSTKFSETVNDISIAKIPVKSGLLDSSLSVIAEPLNDHKLSIAIREGKLNLSQPEKVTAKYLQDEIGFDILAARSLWSFGPDDLQFSSILMDDTFESEVDKQLFSSVKDHIILGFNWAVSEGPLCEEPIRNTKFRILDAVLNGSSIVSAGTQMIPMARKACYTGFLTASPKLMEPIYSVSITCTPNVNFAVEKLLQSRRGQIVDIEPIPGTQFVRIEGTIPVIDSIGFESDVRMQTQGQAMCFLYFSKWQNVPGDPLDGNVYIPQLKPAPQESLARDFVMKTRRRKGLNGVPSIQKYIEPDLFARLKESEIVD